MKITESQLEQVIYNTYKEQGPEALKALGLNLRGDMYKQVPLGDYGRLDLLTVEKTDTHIYLTVVELKKKSIDLKTINQTFKYVAGAFEALWSFSPLKDLIEGGLSFDIRTVVVGSDIHTDAGFLCTYSDKIKAFTYVYDVYNGIRFKQFQAFQYRNHYPSRHLPELIGFS